MGSKSKLKEGIEELKKNIGAKNAEIDALYSARESMEGTLKVLEKIESKKTPRKKKEPDKADSKDKK